MKHKSRTKRATTNNSNQDLKIKYRKLGTFKSLPPRRLNRMLCAINRRENRQDINNKDDYSISYNEPDLCNDYISMKQDKTDRFSISFPRHCVFGHVLLDTHSMKWIHGWSGTTIQGTKECRPSQIKSNTNSKENNKQQEITTEE